jgi:hypothetical protein
MFNSLDNHSVVLTQHIEETDVLASVKKDAMVMTISSTALLDYNYTRYS